MADDKRREEDTLVALVLILGKLLKADDRTRGSWTSADSADRALELISKERERILAKLQ